MTTQPSGSMGEREESGTAEGGHPADGNFTNGPPPNGPPGFRGLDPDKRIRIYTRHLPHRRQDGATYFVTFRLADSLPEDRKSVV